jgi:hypothetical protein
MTQDIRPPPRDISCPSFRYSCPKVRAQGKPGAQCTRSLACKNKKHASVVTTGSPEVVRPSLRDGVNDCSALFLVIGLSCHHRQRFRPAGLISASRYQNHTTSPSATGAFVSCACCVHRIFRPTFCDDRETPLMRAEDARKNAGDLPVVTSEKACDKLTRRANHLVIPEGARRLSGIHLSRRPELRFRNTHDIAATSDANFGIKGALVI